MTEPRHGFHIPHPRRLAWEPIFNKLGPEWAPIKIKPKSVTITAMKREAVAFFVDLAGVTFGRLTPAGMALRDAWMRSANKKYVKAQPRQKPGTQKRHSGK